MNDKDHAIILFQQILDVSLSSTAQSLESLIDWLDLTPQGVRKAFNYSTEFLKLLPTYVGIDGSVRRNLTVLLDTPERDSLKE